MRIGCSLFDFARNEWTKAVIDYWKNEIANDILYRKSKRIQIFLWYFQLKDAIKYGWITILDKFDSNIVSPSFDENILSN